jgi:hypothetical protein
MGVIQCATQPYQLRALQRHHPHVLARRQGRRGGRVRRLLVVAGEFVTRDHVSFEHTLQWHSRVCYTVHIHNIPVFWFL